jgi:hypothetical protein
MKLIRSIALAIFSLIMLSSSCKKHTIPPGNQLSLLPPATQTGANTFGCLVNGQAFVPGGSIFNGAPYQCNYIYTGGGYYFTVAAHNKTSDGTVIGIALGTDSLAVTEGQAFLFNTNTPRNATASYNLAYAHGGVTSYVTNSKISGKLIITKFDQTKQIISGTFYFNAIDFAGDTVKITNGRFDMLYTR